MHSFDFRLRVAAIAVLAAAFGLMPLAAPADSGDGDAASGLDVARLSVVRGSVAIERGDGADPMAAAPNAPVLGGDYLTTGSDGRAELELDGRTQLRLGAGTQARLVHLDRRARIVQLAAGTVELRIFGDLNGAEIDTPSIAIRPQRPGAYRVSVTPIESDVTVRNGLAAIVTPNGNQHLASGTTLVAQGPSVTPSLTTEAAIALDAFDTFNQERDAIYQRMLAQRAYVDGTIGGVADLGLYGRWVLDDRYGEVWIPNTVPAGWAPYRQGRWVWEEGYGWTWLGYEPWGWAPYHYGRWYYSSAYGAWAWYPPRPAVVVPAWSPAIVAFFSFGGSGFSFAAGNVGWVPLAPMEPFHPWWGPHVTVVNNVTNVTVTQTTIVHQYRNALSGGTTAVEAQRFTQGRFDRVTAVAPERLRHVRFVQGAAPIVPSAVHRQLSDHPVAPQLAARRPAATFAAQRFATAHVAVTPARHAASHPAPRTGAHRETRENARKDERR
jgi:hypothetical protein